MSIELLKAVYAKLTSGTNAFKTAVGSRIYANEAPARSTLPLAIYAFDAPMVERTFSGKHRETATFSVTVYVLASAGVAAASDIEKDLFSLMDDTVLTGLTGYDRAVVHCLDRGVPEADGEAFRVDSRYQIIAATTS